MERALAAGYNVVLAPLRPELSATMNMTAVWQWVDSVLGVDYGYEVGQLNKLNKIYSA